MRLLTILLVVLSALWGGYWVVGSRALDAGVTAYLDGLPAQGTPASYASAEVWGFPNRFDLTVTEPALGDPDLLQWRAPFVQLLALSYAPHKLIAVLPGSQQIVTPAQTLTLTNGKAEASIGFLPALDLPLDRIILIVERPTLTSDIGWTIDAEQLRFAVEPVAGHINTHHVGLDLMGLTPDPGLRASLNASGTAGPGGTLPATVETLRLDLTAQLSGPLDRFAFDNGGPDLAGPGSADLTLSELNLTSLQLQWGTMLLQASGTLRRGASGTAEGGIVIRLRDWRRMVALTQTTGLVDPVLAGNLTRALEVLEGMDDNPAELDVPVRFANGRVILAGLPLFPAPNF